MYRSTSVKATYVQVNNYTDTNKIEITTAVKTTTIIHVTIKYIQSITVTLKYCSRYIVQKTKGKNYTVKI